MNATKEAEYIIPPHVENQQLMDTTLTIFISKTLNSHENLADLDKNLPIDNEDLAVSQENLADSNENLAVSQEKPADSNENLAVSTSNVGYEISTLFQN
jgi:hypothetical protein